MKPLMQEVPWRPPEEVFHPFATEPWAILLQSKAFQISTGRYSFVGFDPFDTVSTAPGVFERLQAWTRLYVLEAHPDLPPLQGGILGFLGYEASPLLPSPLYDTPPFPDVALGCYDALMAFDHQTQQVWVISSGFPELEPALQHQRATLRLAWLLSRYNTPLLPSPVFMPVTHQTVTSNFTPHTYQQAVLETQEAILNGDFFEANISQQFQLPKPVQFNTWAFYVASGQNNLAPFSAYFLLPEGAIVCHSPERFIQCTGREARTYPIKGTCRRDACPEKDAALQQALETSEKDRAENIMIVDLMRNDFSPVCLPHTVKATELCKLYSFSTVHHLISTIQGTLAPPYNAIDLLQRCFPGGSITGAPKIEVMKHIQKIEQVRRGPYCGTLGYISFHETLDTAILIRTCTVTSDMLYFQAGGAITLDSEPESEYQETLDKAQVFLRVLST
jgi:para-aminobenzoate synthetase component 1